MRASTRRTAPLLVALGAALAATRPAVAQTLGVTTGAVAGPVRVVAAATYPGARALRLC